MDATIQGNQENCSAPLLLHISWDFGSAVSTYFYFLTPKQIQLIPVKIFYLLSLLIACPLGELHFPSFVFYCLRSWKNCNHLWVKNTSLLSSSSLMFRGCNGSMPFCRFIFQNHLQNFPSLISIGGSLRLTRPPPVEATSFPKDANHLWGVV